MIASENGSYFTSNHPAYTPSIIIRHCRNRSGFFFKSVLKVWTTGPFPVVTTYRTSRSFQHVLQ